MPLLDLAHRSLDEYVAAGGGRGLEVALGASPEAVIDEVAKSGLRGRGGAGFPTADKWRSIRSTGTGARFAVCNGAEGEPATFKDRTLLRTNPYQVIEGLAIAAYAIGAERAYIGIKEAFTIEVDAVRRAIDEMRAADALGPIPVDLVLGPDLYLFGEETGLEEVIEGRPPLPRIARPFMLGLFAKPPDDNPTLVNNVETLANVAHILSDGPDWLRANGTDRSPGTMVFTVCGDVRREGVFELPLGTPLRHLVEELGGGPPDGRSLKAIFPGASNTVLAPGEFDVPMDSGQPSCGGIGPRCRGVRGLRRFRVHGEGRASLLALPVARIVRSVLGMQVRYGRGHGAPREDRGGRSVGPGRRVHLDASQRLDGRSEVRAPHGESLLIQSLVQVFGDDFRRHSGGSCPYPRELPFHKIVDRDATTERFIYDEGYATRQPDWTFDT